MVKSRRRPSQSSSESSVVSQSSSESDTTEKKKGCGPTPAKKFKRIRRIVSSDEEDSVPLSVLKEKLAMATPGAANTSTTTINQKSFSAYDLDMSLAPKKIKAQRVRNFEVVVLSEDEFDDQRNTPGPSNRSRKVRKAPPKAKIAVDDLDLQAVLENMNPNKSKQETKWTDDKKDVKPLFQFENPKMKNADLKWKVKKEEAQDASGPILVEDEEPGTSFVRTTKPPPSRDFGEFDRPSNANGKIRGPEYEQQKALTIDKLQKIQEEFESRPKPTEQAEQPKSFKIPLKPHQLRGLKFMLWRESQSVPGGIIADEMGLGKTGLAIGLIASQLHLQVQERAETPGRLHKGGTLIVAPASLLHQWDEEIHKFCPRTLRVCIHHGDDRESSPLRIALNYDVVLTSFSLVSGAHKKQTALFRIEWDRIILDEGHAIRNCDSLQSRACCELSAKNRWVLTGTPIHNREMDMYSLFKFLAFAPFNDRQTFNRFLATTTTQKGRLRFILENILLRRTKSELQKIGLIKPLPPKEIIEMRITLREEEQAVHDFWMALSQDVFARFAEQHIEKHPELEEMLRDHKKRPKKGLLNLRKKILALFGTSRIKQHHILVLLLRLRQIVCHPGLIHTALPAEDQLGLFADDEEDDRSQSGPQSGSKTAPKFDFAAELTQLVRKERKKVIKGNKSSGADRKSCKAEEDCSDEEEEEDSSLSKAHALLSHDNPVFDLKRPSSKITDMMPRLTEMMDKGEKVIVVSTFVSFLNIIAKQLKEQGIDYFIFSGKTKLDDRNDIVNEFNSSHSKTKVLLLSMLAGGCGLNLVGANNMFLLDLYWNPQMENQVMDRIHRFGQVKSVTIVKFVCNNTIEEYILKLQNKKLEIAKDALEGERIQKNITVDDMRELFGM